MKKTLSVCALSASGSTYAAICKQLFLLVFITGICSSGYAQQTAHEKINTATDKVEYQGYSIRPIVAMDGSLGYDILKNNKILLHQYRPPVMNSRLYKKEDAYKVAEWTIGQYLKTKHFPPFITAAAVKNLHLSSTH